MVDLGVAAGSRPITWLVDPAVIDSVARLVDGNPPRSLEPTVDDETTRAGTPESPAGPDPSDSGDGGDRRGDEEASRRRGAARPHRLAAAAEAGAPWLEDLHGALEGSQILTLPYGDVDVAAASRYDDEVYRRGPEAVELVTSAPGASRPHRWWCPPSGYIDERRASRGTEASTPILVTDRMFGSRAPAVARAEGHTPWPRPVSGAIKRAPGPGDPVRSDCRTPASGSSARPPSGCSRPVPQATDRRPPDDTGRPARPPGSSRGSNSTGSISRRSPARPPSPRGDDRVAVDRLAYPDSQVPTRARRHPLRRGRRPRAGGLHAPEPVDRERRGRLGGPRPADTVVSSSA